MAGSPDLPDTPLIRIRPSRSWIRLGLHDLWNYRDLLFFLTLRDIQVRYRQTLLGVGWAIIQPLTTMLLFTLFFGRLAKIPSDGIPYPLFAYAGLLPWTFVSNSVTSSGDSLVGNANLITKVYFPRLIIPASAVLAGLVDLAISFGLLGVLLVAYALGGTEMSMDWHLVLLVPLVVLTTLLTMAVGLLMSALNVKYRDVRYGLPFLVQAWMFATPIIYPSSLVPERWRWALALNPLAGYIEGYRAALFGRPFSWQGLGISTAVTFALLLYAVYSFRRMERTFADII